MMCPKKGGYGDYVKMGINEEGFIDNWKCDFSEFINEDEQYM